MVSGNIIMVVILSGTNIIRDNIITSNIQDNPILKFHIYTRTIFLLANFSFVNRKWFRRKKKQQLYVRDARDFQ